MIKKNSRRIIRIDMKNHNIDTVARDKCNRTEFVIPDDVGGRFSVLTAVGLLPIAVAGINIDDLMNGAKIAREDYSKDFSDNDCYKYAAIRNISGNDVIKRYWDRGNGGRETEIRKTWSRVRSIRCANLLNQMLNIT